MNKTESCRCGKGPGIRNAIPLPSITECVMLARGNLELFPKQVIVDFQHEDVSFGSNCDECCGISSFEVNVFQRDANVMRHDKRVGQDLATKDDKV